MCRKLGFHYLYKVIISYIFNTFIMEIKMNTQINEYGLYSTKKYKKNEIIFVLSGKLYDYPTRETIYIGNNQHIYDDYGKYMNHSFDSSTYIDKYNVVALHDIEIETELTFNYNDNEINMACPFMIGNICVKGKN